MNSISEQRHCMERHSCYD